MSQNKPALSENINTLDNIYGKLNSSELQVFVRLVKGQMYKSIAADLSISMPMVKQYAHRIYKKLEVNNRIEILLRYAVLISAFDNKSYKPLT